MPPVEKILRTSECEVCKETLNIVQVKAWRGSTDPDREAPRVIAVEVESGKQHVCFSLPSDANLLVLED